MRRAVTILALPAMLFCLASGSASAQFDHLADSDCANCHLNSSGQLNLMSVHNFRCSTCHDFGDPDRFTILGPEGTVNRDDVQCALCHNPTIPETGNAATPTKGHRCIVCHGEQRSTRDVDEFHEKHIREANCVVCHGFIPETGDELAGSREICVVCHGYPREASVETIHRKHVPEGLSCEECHGLNTRPPVDTVASGVPGVANVCQICHDDKRPEEFFDEFEKLHKRHTDKRIDCGACHADANFQDDRSPMFPIDDPRRQFIGRGRGGFQPCYHCHEDGEHEESPKVHEKHVADMWQWCFNCHTPDDGRPQGLVPGLNDEPANACVVCHDDETYRDSFPFEIHERHAGENKCYACHQTRPPFFDWPDHGWLEFRGQDDEPDDDEPDDDEPDDDDDEPKRRFIYSWDAEDGPRATRPPQRRRDGSERRR